MSFVIINLIDISHRFRLDFGIFLPWICWVLRLYLVFPGFEILAFPCNQFLKQEPGSSEQAQEFACTRYKAEYPIFHKVKETIICIFIALCKISIICFGASNTVLISILSIMTNCWLFLLVDFVDQMLLFQINILFSYFTPKFSVLFIFHRCWKKTILIV